MCTSNTGLGEAFVGYRVINCDKASLSLFAGARYTYLEGDLSIFNNGDARLIILRRLLGIRNKLDFSASTDWVDPVIGARGKVKIWKATSLYAEADVGGFDANSGSAFEIQREGRTIARELRWTALIGATKYKAASNFKLAGGSGRRLAGAI